MTNRKLSGWKDMGADRHLVETLRKRLMANAQLIHLKKLKIDFVGIFVPTPIIT